MRLKIVRNVPRKVQKQLIELNTEFNDEKELKDNERSGEISQKFNIEKLPALILKRQKKKLRLSKF